METTNGTATLADMTQVFTLAQLQTMQKTYKASPSILALLDTAIKTKEAQELEAKLLADFDASILALANLPKPPASVHNVYLAWQEVEVNVGEPVEVEVVRTPAVVELKPDGSTIIKTPAITEREFRQPTAKVWQWTITRNKGFDTGKAKVSTNTGTTQTASTKRAITVKHIVNNQVEVIGNFSNGAEACKHLKLNVGANSATRVLQNNGFTLEPYTGTDMIA